MARAPRRQRRKARGRARADRPDVRTRPRADASGRAHPAPTPLLLGVVACFVLSGFAALLYQTAWLRQFSLIFGTSELAVVTVLAAYMAGLAAGAAAAARYIGRIRRPMLVYGILEAGIAVSALLVPLLLALAGNFYAALLGGRPDPPDAATLGQPLFYLLVGFVVLALPTGFMGATLPLLIRHVVRDDREVGPRVALLYATNTAGAVAGTLAAGFVLLPALGLQGTVWVGVAVNALVFGIAALLARSAPPLEVEEATVGGAGPQVPGFFRSCVAPFFAGSAAVPERAPSVFDSQPAWILPLMLVSGATAFVYEVLWTRMLAHVLGGSIFAFATMLAAFLTGIALGSGLAGRVAGNRRTAALAFALAQMGIAFCSMGVYAWMGRLLPASRELGAMVGYAVAVMLPATVFIGATFPLAVRVLACDEREAGAGTAWVYSWNTVGAIAGAILAGFVIIPGLGFEGTVTLAVSVNLGLALWSLAFVARRERAWVGVALLGLLGTLLFYRPDRPESVVSRGGFGEVTDLRETFYAVGRTSTVRVVAGDGAFKLLSNGLPEASIHFPGGPPVPNTQKWLTALPALARPDARSMLVIGFGGGVALEDVPSSITEIDVIEIEPEIIRANETLRSDRARDPLSDPRQRVVYNDARNALRLTTRRWDVIVSQPSHPWTAGASHLFTREFVRDARGHLRPGGVFVQWMGSPFMTADLLRSLSATLLEEFPHVRLYHPSAKSLVFLASAEILEPEAELAGRPGRFAEDLPRWARTSIVAVEDLVAALVMDTDALRAFADGAAASTDDDNRMATRSRSRGDGLMLPELESLFAPHDLVLQPESAVHARYGDALDFGYVAWRMITLPQPARAKALSQTVRDEATRHQIAARIFALYGDMAGSHRALRDAIAADPEDMQSRYMLMRSLARQGATAEAQTVANDLSGQARTLLEGWQHAASGNWKDLAALDAALARSRVTDVWFPEAFRLRALWRVNRNDPVLAREALTILDPACLVFRESDLYALYQLRGLAAVQADEYDVLVESVRDILASIRAKLQGARATGRPVSGAELAALGRDLGAVAGPLEAKLPELPPGTHARATEVLASARELSELLAAASGQ